ncbi:hypothetical protein Zmor_017495 [Zophobas morio]|uniref:Uncharacterized protein n=1 Tax=Zophobas morio TaxID=2755281 RepID=A0AA38I8X4_9CUCU|nr:hypothetical protein Zmor_017495 [Zophobas morio]
MHRSATQLHSNANPMLRTLPPSHQKLHNYPKTDHWLLEIRFTKPNPYHKTSYFLKQFLGARWRHIEDVTRRRRFNFVELPHRLAPGAVAAPAPAPPFLVRCRNTSLIFE